MRLSALSEDDYPEPGSPASTLDWSTHKRWVSDCCACTVRHDPVWDRWLCVNCGKKAMLRDYRSISPQELACKMPGKLPKPVTTITRIPSKPERSDILKLLDQAHQMRDTLVMFTKASLP